MKRRRSSGAEISPLRQLPCFHGRSAIEDSTPAPIRTILRRHFPKGGGGGRSRASFTFKNGDEAQQQCRCHSPAALPMAVAPRHSSPAHPPQRTALPEPTHAVPRPASSRSTFRFVPSQRTVTRRAQVRAPCFAVRLTSRARQCTTNGVSP